MTLASTVIEKSTIQDSSLLISVERDFSHSISGDNQIYYITAHLMLALIDVLLVI